MSIQEVLGEYGKSGLKDSLSQALAALETTYGVQDGGTGSLSAASVENFATKVKTVVKKFEDLFSEVANMRSSYIPFELAQESVDLSGNITSMQQIAGEEALMESYENTFMRMLGMPSTSDISASDYLSYISIQGELIEDQSYVYSRYESILDKRQLDPGSREFVAGNKAFDMASQIDTCLNSLVNTGYSSREAMVNMAELFSFIVLSQDKSDFQVQQAVDQLVGILTGNQHVSESQSALGIYPEIILNVLTGRYGSEEAFGDEGLLGEDSIYYIFTTAVAGLETNEMLRVTLQGMAVASPGEEGEAFFRGLWNELVLRQALPSVQTLSDNSNFYRYSYLLYPPVQDGRISGCINEPGKIVAEPFLPSSMRTVNGRPLKSSLLESIIRIRLDKTSGTSTYMPTAENLAPPLSTSVSNKEAEFTFEDIVDSMGLLEALVVTRLSLSVVAFATAMRDDIEEMARVQRNTGLIPDENRSQASDNSTGGVTRPGGSSAVAQATASIEEMTLDLELAIEDSLMMLFGDNSTPAALDLQSNTQRNSGVKSGHLMSSVLSILSLPRQFIGSRREEIDEENQRAAAKTGDEIRRDVASKIGFTKGVGALDILAIVTALFTMPETLLLSLLSPTQFDNMRKEFPDGFFDSFERRTIADAVNDVTKRSYDVYQLFLKTLEIGRIGVFVYTNSQED